MTRKPSSKLENTESEKVLQDNTEVKKKAATRKSSAKITSNKSSTKKTPTKVSTKSSKTSSKKTATSEKGATKRSTSTTRSSKKKTAVTEIAADEITSTTNLTKKIEVLEYYDLPYRYNQTVVKVLAQTPTTLFIYWDISDADRANFVEKYGKDFFNNTKPVLVICNKTMHYSFEIEIDDFANSWYLHVNDSNCEYSVELGRRPKYYNEERHIDIPNDYLYVTSSNNIEAPNDHVLFDRSIKTVYFKDVKTNIITAKDVTSIAFLRNIGRIYNLYDLQSDFNKNSWIDGEHWQLNLRSPSSSSPSSTFKK